MSGNFKFPKGKSKKVLEAMLKLSTFFDLYTWHPKHFKDSLTSLKAQDTFFVTNRRFVCVNQRNVKDVWDVYRFASIHNWQIYDLLIEEMSLLLINQNLLPKDSVRFPPIYRFVRDLSVIYDVKVTLQFVSMQQWYIKTFFSFH